MAAERNVAACNIECCFQRELCIMHAVWRVVATTYAGRLYARKPCCRKYTAQRRVSFWCHSL